MINVSKKALSCCKNLFHDTHVIKIFRLPGLQNDDYQIRHKTICKLWCSAKIGQQSAIIQQFFVLTTEIQNSCCIVAQLESVRRGRSKCTINILSPEELEFTEINHTFKRLQQNPLNSGRSKITHVESGWDMWVKKCRVVAKIYSMSFLRNKSISLALGFQNGLAFSRLVALDID